MANAWPGAPFRAACVAEGRVRQHLREATAQAHARLDAMVEAWGIETAPGYRRFLQAHARSLPALEQRVWGGLAQAGFVPARWSRAAALAQDLAALGAPAPEPLPAPDITGEAALFGAAYVLEGSRLGAQMLLRRAWAGAPTHAFLAHNPEPRAWQVFLSRLEASSAAAAPVAAAEGALAAFAHYARGFAELRMD
jgi:heme oxygenase